MSGNKEICGNKKNLVILWIIAIGFIMEKRIEIEKQVADGCPSYAMIYMEADVTNGPVSDDLKLEFGRLTGSMTELYEVADINKRPPIAATRKAYKIFGKDPNRYRPSQEQLMRRVVRGLGLYDVSALVDSGNMLSLATGWSVGVRPRQDCGRSDQTRCRSGGGGVRGNRTRASQYKGAAGAS